MLGVAPFVAVCALVMGLAACGSAAEQEEPTVPDVQTTITVTSSAFTEGRAIPVEFSCDGAGRIRPLAWSGAPADAAALALVVDDPDAPSGTFTHWAVLDLPSGTSQLAGESLPSGAVQAMNSGGRP